MVKTPREIQLEQEIARMRAYIAQLDAIVDDMEGFINRNDAALKKFKNEFWLLLLACAQAGMIIGICITKIWWGL